VNTLKTFMVLAVLAVVGYGLYLGLNNGFQFQNTPKETPDWLKQEMGAQPATMPEVGLPQQQPAPAQVTAGGTQIPQASYPTASYPTAQPANVQPTEASAAGTRNQVAGHAVAATGGPKGPVAIAPPEGSSTGPIAVQIPGSVKPHAVDSLPDSSPPASAAEIKATVAQPTGTGLNHPAYPAGAAPAASGRLPQTTPLATPPVAKLVKNNSQPPLSNAAIPNASNPPVQNPPLKNQPSRPNHAFQTALGSARTQLQQGRLASALLTLSIWYEDPRLQTTQHAQLTELLDRIAGSVIYSRKHLIEPAYRVQQGETISDIAKAHQIPEGLLVKINGIKNPARVSPGQELKVVRGPFNATINSKKHELTLWLGGRYAGRFTLSLGPEFEQIVGPFVVQDKTRVHTSHNNQPWIQLGPGFGSATGVVPTGPQLGIAGMQQPEEAAQGERPGRIGVSVADADDLFDILSQGSKVTIRR
jgi:LysM repeat protein